MGLFNITIIIIVNTINKGRPAIILELILT